MSELNRKFEKIASAIYLVTGFFNDNEPIKWRLRNLCMDLVSSGVKDKFSLIAEISALLSVAKTAGLVSETNHEILFAEISTIRQELERPLDLKRISELTTSKVLENRGLAEPALSEESESIKDKEVYNRPVLKPALKEFGAVSVKKNSRQSIIIALLKRKKEVMIKDITPLISGCSEKTIQRELSAMVQAGILKKVGEKRWSRYYLA